MTENNHSNKLKEFYNHLDTINSNTDNTYPDIQCKTQCNRCCKFYGSPEIFDFEWENIKSYINENFSINDIKRIKRKLEDGLNNLKNSTDSLVNSESFFECPFIYKNKCSIYENRPFICRVFGYTKENNKILTCSEELNRWETILNSIDLGDLPQKEKLQNILTEIYDNKFEVNTIIYWLKKTNF